MSEGPQESAGLNIVSDPAPKRAAPPKKRKRWIIPVSILAGVIVLALVAVGVGLGLANHAMDNIKRDPTLPVDPLPTVAASEGGTVVSGQAMNFLIMGSDTRTTSSADGRSDVLMVAHLNAAHDQLYIISFPRDMYVNIPGYGMGKINAAFAYGGPPLMIKTLKGMLNDIPINHVATIDFENFVNLSDAIGGVTINNDIAFSSAPYTYPKGEITMSGAKLLAYVRDRHNVPDGDLDRAHHQRMVLTAMIDKILSKQTLTNPSALLQVANQLGTFVTVDSTLTNTAIVQLAMSLHISAASIVDLQAPISGFATNASGDVDVVNATQLAAMSTALQNDDMASYVKTYGTSYYGK